MPFLKAQSKNFNTSSEAALLSGFLYIKMNDAVLMGQLSLPLALTIDTPMPGTLNQSAPAAAAAKVRPPTRLVSARDFVVEVARAGGFRRDAAPFLERYVFGSGAPALVAAFTYHRKRNVLEVAIRQSGSPAAARAAAAAEAAAPKEGSSVGLVRLAVREPAGYAEHLVHVGAAPTVLAELRVAPPLKKSM